MARVRRLAATLAVAYRARCRLGQRVPAQGTPCSCRARRPLRTSRPVQQVYACRDRVPSGVVVSWRLPNSNGHQPVWRKCRPHIHLSACISSTPRAPQSRTCHACAHTVLSPPPSRLLHSSRRRRRVHRRAARLNRLQRCHAHGCGRRGGSDEWERQHGVASGGVGGTPRRRQRLCRQRTG